MKCVAIISYSVYSLFDDGVTLRSGGEFDKEAEDDNHSIVTY